MRLGPHQPIHFEKVVSDLQGVDPPAAQRNAQFPGRQLRLNHWILSGGIDVGIYAMCAGVWYLITAGALGIETLAITLGGWIIFAVLGEFVILVWIDRTIGKSMMGLMVVDSRPDRRFMSPRQAATRTLTKAMILYGIGIGLPWLLDHYVLAGTLWWAILLLNALLIPLLIGIYRKDRRGLHDLIAKTKVIRP